MLSLANQLTGINAVNIYSTTIYQNIQDESGGDGGISPRVGTCLNGAAQVIGAAASPLVAYFSFRTIINGGFLILAVSMIVLSIFTIEGWNTILVIIMMVYIASY